MTMHKVLYTRDDIHYTCQEKKQEEDSQALKITWMHQYWVFENHLKKRGKKTD